MKPFIFSLFFIFCVASIPHVAAEPNPEPVTGMEFVRVPGGCFQMGSNNADDDSNERPAHEICVSIFEMGKYKVTQGQWQAVMGNNPSHFAACGKNCPVENVSWQDVQTFTSKINAQSKEKAGYRLPTEAEWEYACRFGGTQEKYCGGDALDQVAWYNSNSNKTTHPVGRKAPNRLGLYDMNGNVWEWVADWYDKDFYITDAARQKNPICTNSASGNHTLRGGSWNYIAEYVHATHRNWGNPDYRDSDDGFRLVRMPVQE